MTAATPMSPQLLPPLVRPEAAPWRHPALWWPRLDAATRHLDAPIGVLGLDALAANAHDLLDRAQGSPIRVASKSVRVRAVLDAVLALPGYRGILAYTLAEALWLASPSPGGGGSAGEGHDDIVVGYPTADRGALARLARDPVLASRVTLMIDDPAQLDLVDAVAPPTTRAAPIRVAIELDASYRTRLLGHVGVRRSPLHTVHDVRALAEAVAGRAGFVLVGMMAYEAQIAGVTNRGPDKLVIRAMQAASAAELRERRGEAVAAVRRIADLAFVNGGGTGSLESTHDDPSVTEIAAGSGLFGPHLFDGYTAFTPAPAVAFGLDVVRRPTAEIATVLGGGWIASGPPGADRLPRPVWPHGLHYLPREAAGEVQTPLTGAAAGALAIGDRVWFRHTKAGEIAEHLATLAVVQGDAVVAEISTYRGEGRLFL